MAKPKQGRKVVAFEVTSKKADELKKDSNAGIFYRVLEASEKPLRRPQIYAAAKPKCESEAAWKRLGGQIGDTLARLIKAGFVKRLELREETKAASKPNGSPKPHRPRKPRNLSKRDAARPAAEPPTTAAERAAEDNEAVL